MAPWPASDRALYCRGTTAPCRRAALKEFSKMGLIAKKCVPCQGGIPPLSRDEAENYLGEVPEWSLTHEVTRVERRFQFPDFVAAMGFVQKVGELAEDQGHHPDITFGWGYAQVVFYTHKIKGLHENDFIMAAKVDALA
jgi:4a-hydroxytetrahydrobiopterin dehydratase